MEQLGRSPRAPFSLEHRGRLRILLTRNGDGIATQPRTTAVMLMTQAPRTLDPRIAASIGLDAPAPGEPEPRLFAMDATGTFELPLAPRHVSARDRGVAVWVRCRVDHLRRT